MFKENPDYKNDRSVKVPRQIIEKFDYRARYETLPAPANENSPPSVYIA